MRVRKSLQVAGAKLRVGGDSRGATSERTVRGAHRCESGRGPTRRHDLDPSGYHPSVITLKGDTCYWTSCRPGLRAGATPTAPCHRQPAASPAPPRPYHQPPRPLAPTPQRWRAALLPSPPPAAPPPSPPPAEESKHRGPTREEMLNASMMSDFEEQWKVAGLKTSIELDLS